ncbi:MAG TPA: hypothetical protein VGR19_06975 [Allosphingosinicella sp.]|nr:hypothetical protein [Allosphingosinicella sp.]
MPRHDPVPPRRQRTKTDSAEAELRRAAELERTALAWARYKRLMSWMAIAAVVAVLLALIYLKSSGRPVPLHMMIATIAGVGFTVLLGTGLMGLAYFSSHSGHDEAAHRGEDNQ